MNGALFWAPFIFACVAARTSALRAEYGGHCATPGMTRVVLIIPILVHHDDLPDIATQDVPVFQDLAGHDEIRCQIFNEHSGTSFVHNPSTSQWRAMKQTRPVHHALVLLVAP